MAGKRVYEIRWGDTLSDVAHRHGTTVKDICRINGIDDPDRIEAGRVIALKAREVCTVRFLFIDWDRNPIQGAKVRLEYCGKTKMLTSKANGSVSEIITETPEDLVAVSIMRLDGSWETVARVRSGWGNKLVTLVSPKLKLVAETAKPRSPFHVTVPSLQHRRGRDSRILVMAKGLRRTQRIWICRDSAL